MALCCLSFQTTSKDKVVYISFLPMFQDKALVLNNEKYITEKNDTVMISTLKFYVSNITLEGSNGEVFKENKSVHLLNIEALNTLQFQMEKVPNFKIKKIRFYVGIDSMTNVSGDLSGDLDPSLGMYWAWNSGYINMKLEGKSSSCKTPKKEFQFHIGGYLEHQNALQEVILDFPDDSNSIKIKTDLSAWLNSVSLKETNAVMIPGIKAITMSKLYKNMFQTLP
jgi:hypothetical protein